MVVVKLVAEAEGYGKRGMGERYQNSSYIFPFETETYPVLLALFTVINSLILWNHSPGQDTK